LQEKEHILHLRVAEKKEEGSLGHCIRIGAFFVVE